SEDWDGDGVPEVDKRWDFQPEQPDDAHYRGKLARIEDPTGVTDHVYDERGRVIETTLDLAGQRYTSGSRFDGLDREVLHVYPDGSSLRIHRNPRGQLAGYGDALRIEYDGDGLELERRFNTGVLQQSAYDADRRHDELVALAADGSTIEHVTWRFDGAGNVLSIQDLRPAVSSDDDRSESYEYDNLYRLSGARGSWGETRWTYSASGNLLSRTSDIAGQSASDIRYEGAAPHAITQLGARSLSYDALGRLSHDGDRSYTWNNADQLIAVSNAKGAALENDFDAAGIRRTRSETSASGERSTVHFISPWSEVKDGKLVRYIVHADRRITRLADDTGQAVTVSKPQARPSTQRHIASSALAGALAMLVAIALALGWRLRGAGKTQLRWLAPLAAVALLDACSADHDARSTQLQLAGSVTTLGEADTLLINDQLGTLLAETSASGSVRARFAAYPYGLTRHDTSSESQQYAAATRDETIGLDLMGARFYAPDLGIWTTGDPLAINDPERSASAEFATANPYAYANLNPTTASDPDGNFWHIAVGAGVGAVLGGSIEAARQYAATGRIEDWGRVSAAAAGGAVAGAIQSALPGTGAVAMLAIGGSSGAAGGLAQRLVASGGKSAGTLSDVVVDATIGGATAGVLRGASVALRNASVRPPVASGRVLGSEAAFRRQYGELGRANDLTRASLPVGRRGAPLTVASGTNAPAKIDRRHFTGHALDQMQSRGFTPTAVENAIQHGVTTPGNRAGTFQHLFDDIRVITNKDGGVITVIPR
ncbi:MAG: RHS repeat-associated core domain-containing protein, partial [Polyangiaceae bacterium]